MTGAAKKSLGQHFLASETAVARILETVRFLGSAAAGIVEVGPGRGALTAGLAAMGKPLWAVEVDRDLAAEIGARFPALRVTEADARVFDWCTLRRVSGLHPWLLVANLPYNAGTEILWQVLLRRDTFCGLVVMLQREVARKFSAGAGEEGYGPQAAWTRPWWRARILFTVPPGAFRPQPKVTSAVCVFMPEPAIEIPTSRQLDYWAFLRRAFRQPRKTLLANLAAGWPGEKPAWGRLLASAGVESVARPGQVPPERLEALFLGWGVGGEEGAVKPGG